MEYEYIRPKWDLVWTAFISLRLRIAVFFNLAEFMILKTGEICLPINFHTPVNNNLVIKVDVPSNAKLVVHPIFSFITHIASTTLRRYTSIPLLLTDWAKSCLFRFLVTNTLIYNICRPFLPM